jgi:hypothetical protein
LIAKVGCGRRGPAIAGRYSMSILICMLPKLIVSIFLQHGKCSRYSSLIRTMSQEKGDRKVKITHVMRVASTVSVEALFAIIALKVGTVTVEMMLNASMNIILIGLILPACLERSDRSRAGHESSAKRVVFKQSQIKICAFWNSDMRSELDYVGIDSSSDLKLNILSEESIGRSLYQSKSSRHYSPYT